MQLRVIIQQVGHVGHINVFAKLVIIHYVIHMDSMER